MDKYCPDCSTQLTPSIVGYLCHGCGTVHGFEKVATLPISPISTPNWQDIKGSTMESDHSSEETVVQKKDTDVNQNKLHHKLKHHAKKLMVPEILETPELPAPHSIDSENVFLPNDKKDNSILPAEAVTPSENQFNQEPLQTHNQITNDTDTQPVVTTDSETEVKSSGSGIRLTILVIIVISMIALIGLVLFY